MQTDPKPRQVARGESPAVNGASHPKRTPSRLREFALLFVYAWAVYTLIQGGSLLLAEPYLDNLRVAPRAAQGAAGDGYAQTLIKLERTLPAHERVQLVWRRSEGDAVGFWYGYFWATYWLYPRQVDIITDPASLDSSHGILLDVRSIDKAELAAPPGYTISATYPYVDQVVTVFLKSSA
jgi:hypothetical protein